MITDKNYEEIQAELKSYLVQEIGFYIKKNNGMENLSLLLGRSRTYVRMVFNRTTSIERLKELYKECKRKIK